MKKKLMATLAAICSMFLAAGTVAGIPASAESGTPVNMDGNWIETGGFCPHDGADARRAQHRYYLL